MDKFRIPLDLTDMIKARRVIPFIGAGFSASLKLPSWDELLEKIAEEIEDNLTYKEVQNYCNGNALEIAEYYYLKSNKNIGPLRHSISSALKYDISPEESGPHIDLINLGAPQIYTTNYDDIIERAFKTLSISPEVICLAKDVANSFGNKTQIVKFHGDLRFENTLVLTESSYFSRMNFDSPMDIKFRADLLGKSVLFMGYSFRDINIRIIWFKLMEMMKDISIDNRPNSYIVRFTPNPVLEELYESVGIKTIILDPSGKLEKQNYNRVFSLFMLELSLKSTDDGLIPGSSQAQFVSKTIIDNINNNIRILTNSPKDKRNINLYSHKITNQLSIITKRKVHRVLLKYMNALLENLAMLNLPEIHNYTVKIVINLINDFGYSDSFSQAIFCAFHIEEARNIILNYEAMDWVELLNFNFTDGITKVILKNFEIELKQHQGDAFWFFNPSENLSYQVDLLKRIIDSETIHKDLIKSAKLLLEEASKIYPSIKEYQPTKNGKPDVSSIINEITEKSKNNNDDDLPF